MSLSRFYSIAQIEYCRNFIFKRHFPIHNILERSCEIGLWRLTANRISEIFGTRLSKRMRGMATTSSAPTGRTPSPNSTRNSPVSCATNSAPTISFSSLSPSVPTSKTDHIPRNRRGSQRNQCIVVHWTPCANQKSTTYGLRNEVSGELSALSGARRGPRSMKS